ncbi:hypothetical protein AGMMS50256_37820 [Betaproteobacteria bacterium]|nr:hypothetical protein AGMMS50256_37820 [Betaproteobacteria bacterium]
MSLLSLSPCLVERLKLRCPSVNGKVFSTADLSGVQEAAQAAPALHVVLWDYAPVEVLPGRADIRWRETWLVVAVVKNAARKDRAGAQIEAGDPLVAEVLDALAGWRPEARIIQGALKAIPGPRPVCTDTHAYFPLAFEANVVTRDQRTDVRCQETAL